MTTIEDMTDEVRMLELELRKLELNRQITQVKSAPFVDEMSRVGVAKLQDGIGKLRYVIEGRDETISDLLRNDKRLNMFLKEYEETVKNRDKIIHNLQNDVTDISANYQRHNTHLKEKVEALEAELYARKGDSKVLMDVVGIIKAWDERSGRAFPTLYTICNLLVDYIDVPEPPIKEEDPSIDEEHCVAVKVGFLELP